MIPIRGKKKKCAAAAGRNAETASASGRSSAGATAGLSSSVAGSTSHLPAVACRWLLLTAQRSGILAVVLQPTVSVRRKSQSAAQRRG